MTDEKILVIKRQKLFPAEAVQGFLPALDFKKYETMIVEHQEFGWRSAMELDPTYKQIIPYLIFKHNETYFLMRRRSDATEARLKDKYTLGIGGHVRQEDLDGANLIAWAQREFDEEINYSGALNVKPLGLINDDSNAVGQVHVGFVFLLEGDNADISIRSELKEGSLQTLEQMKDVYDRMETWSQRIYDYLIGNTAAF
jgi:predicted NUDIX family phosphoesterase